MVSLWVARRRLVSDYGRCRAFRVLQTREASSPHAQSEQQLPERATKRHQNTEMLSFESPTASILNNDAQKSLICLKKRDFIFLLLSEKQTSTFGATLLSSEKQLQRHILTGSHSDSRVFTEHHFESNMVKWEHTPDQAGSSRFI